VRGRVLQAGAKDAVVRFPEIREEPKISQAVVKMDTHRNQLL